MKAATAAIGIFILVCYTYCSSLAQPSLGLYEVGGGAGAFIYQGDIAPSALGGYKDIQPGFYLAGARYINNYLSVRVQFTSVSLKSYDTKYSRPVWRQQRNLWFTTTVKEVAAQALWNLRGNNKMEKDGRRLAAYLFAGAGLAFTKVHRNTDAFNANYFTDASWVYIGLQADLAHSIPQLLPVIPVGAGITYRLTKNISFTTEANYRFAFSDYLDGFSRSADPSKKDHYYSLSAGILYRPSRNGSIPCPAY